MRTTVQNSSEFQYIAIDTIHESATNPCETVSLAARVVDIDDAQALEWQLVENSQRVDVHPYEEAQGSSGYLHMPGYDVATLV